MSTATDFLKERWTAVREAAGIRWQVFALLVSIAVARLDWIYRLSGGAEAMIFGFPSWILGLTVALAFLFVWMLESTVRLRRQIKSARVEIAILRRRGVEIRNNGMGIITNAAAWLQWERDALDWNDKVISELAKISEADAEWFSVLDVVPPPRLAPQQDAPEEIKDAYCKLFGEHDFRVCRLGKMINRLWGT
jgi:hypothetical protein